MFYLWMIFQKFSYFHSSFIMSLHSHIQGTQTADCKPCFHRSQYTSEPISLNHDFFHEFIVPGDQNSADQIAVSPDIFCHSVHNNIDSHIKRLLKNRSGIGVVDIGFNAVSMSKLCNSLKIYN